MTRRQPGAADIPYTGVAVRPALESRTRVPRPADHDLIELGRGLRWATAVGRLEGRVGDTRVAEWQALAAAVNAEVRAGLGLAPANTTVTRAPAGSPLIIQACSTVDSAVTEVTLPREIAEFFPAGVAARALVGALTDAAVHEAGLRGPVTKFVMDGYDAENPRIAVCPPVPGAVLGSGEVLG